MTSEPVRVLVVDDNEDLVSLLDLALTERGFQVSIATDGRSCLTTLERQAPDLVLLDITMPGRSGYSVLQRIAHYPHRRPRVIVISGDPPSPERQASLGATIDATLAKPFEIDTLFELIDRVLAPAP